MKYNDSPFINVIWNIILKTVLSPGKHYYAPIIIFFLFSMLVQSHAQTISMGSDSTDFISHDSTGYVEQHPLDIPDDRGLFVYSKDGSKGIRFFGSFRMLMVMDDRQQYQPFQVDPPMLPTGEDDFTNLNATWTPNMSRLGLDAMLGIGNGKGVLVRFELDWKGTDEKFRIRHLFIRTQHWILGKTWTSFTALPYLPQTVAGHMTGAASGYRTPQIRYYNRSGNWKYQVSLEYKLASLIKPDTIQAESRVIIPTPVGRFSYHGDWGQIGCAIMLKPNRIQFTGDNKSSQNLLGYGANMGVKYVIKDVNRILFSAYGGSGMGSYIVDYSFADISLIYDPQTADFKNMNIYGGLLAYERDWSKTFSSSFAGSYNYVENKSFQEDLAFNYSYKAIVNLFYKPLGIIRGLVVGAEMLYAERFNKNSSSNRALRASLLVYYDF